MNSHPVKTIEILKNFHFAETLGNVPKIAGAHHEMMDGKGYPDALKGESIPLASRIMAVADVFDALTERRDYPKYVSNKTLSHDPLPLSDVVSIIKEKSGTQFDPNVVKAFLKCLPDIISNINIDRDIPYRA